MLQFNGNWYLKLLYKMKNIIRLKLSLKISQELFLINYSSTIFLSSGEKWFLQLGSRWSSWLVFKWPLVLKAHNSRITFSTVKYRDAMIMESTWGSVFSLLSFYLLAFAYWTNRKNFPIFGEKRYCGWICLSVSVWLLCAIHFNYLYPTKFIIMCLFRINRLCCLKTVALYRFFCSYNFPRAFRYIIFLNYRQHCFCICSSSISLIYSLDKFLELNCLVKGMCNFKRLLMWFLFVCLITVKNVILI